MAPPFILGFIAFWITTCDNLLFVSGHGRLLEPPGRSSLAKIPEFRDLNPTYNDYDNGLNCGGLEAQHSFNKGKCGVCGDAYNMSIPRPNEDGGEYDGGVIVRGYRSGQDIPVTIELTNNHWGYFEFRLCANDTVEAHLAEECYEQNLLKVANSIEETRYNISSPERHQNISYFLTLPKGITCNHCVLQWHWRAAQHWGICDNGKGGKGCGNQETFRGCSDIAIYSEDDTNYNPRPYIQATTTVEPGHTTDDAIIIVAGSDYVPKS